MDASTMRMSCYTVVVMMVVTATAGCRLASQNPPPRVNLADSAKMLYPSDGSLGADLDIVVVCEDGTIDLVNRTPEVFDNVVLWLNQQYMCRVDRIKIGTGNRFALGSFLNRHGESFPRGTFLGPDKAYPVILAELYNRGTGQRHRLLVRLGGS